MWLRNYFWQFNVHLFDYNSPYWLYWWQETNEIFSNKMFSTSCRAVPTSNIQSPTLYLARWLDEQNVPNSCSIFVFHMKTNFDVYAKVLGSNVIVVVQLEKLNVWIIRVLALHSFALLSRNFLIRTKWFLSIKRSNTFSLPLQLSTQRYFVRHLSTVWPQNIKLLHELIAKCK